MPIATKQAIKRITVRSIGKQTCPTCKVKIPRNERVWSAVTIDRYTNGNKQTFVDFCKECYCSVIIEVCQYYCDKTGGMVYINMDKGYARPIWLHSVITSTITVLNNDKVKG